MASPLRDSRWLRTCSTVPGGGANQVTAWSWGVPLRSSVAGGHPVHLTPGRAGTRLLAEVERRLGENAGRLLVVETSGRAAYAPTRAFYARRGYTEVARVRDFYAPGDDRIVFTKRLSPAAPFHPEYHESPAAGGVAEP